jgi:hypothetical protein
MGWSLRWSIRGAIITFTETLNAKDIDAIDVANLPKNLARIHCESA